MRTEVRTTRYLTWDDDPIRMIEECLVACIRLWWSNMIATRSSQATTSSTTSVATRLRSSSNAHPQADSHDQISNET